MGTKESMEQMENIKRNAEKDYITTPLSVLAYISKLEKQDASQQQTIERLREALKELVCIVKIHSKATKNNFAWAELEEAEQLLNTTEPIDSEHGFIECGVCWGEGYVEINEDTESVVCWHCNGKKKIKKNQ